MKILVTGASGFVGRAIMKGLVQTGRHEVVGLSRRLPSQWEIPGARCICCDLTEGVALAEQVDYIVHCAAARNLQNTPLRNFMAANLAMTGNVAKYGSDVGVKGVIFTSSVSIHGEIRAEVVDENTAITNPTAYGISKSLCERILQDYQRYFPVVALRLCGVVGPGAENVWLARVLSAALRGEAIHIVNAQRPFNNVLHTDDILRFVLSLTENGFSGFNAFPLASGFPLTIRSVVEEIVRGTSSAARIIDDGVTDYSYTISNDYAIDHFNYEPGEVMANVMKYVLGAN